MRVISISHDEKAARGRETDTPKKAKNEASDLRFEIFQVSG